MRIGQETDWATFRRRNILHSPVCFPVRVQQYLQMLTYSSQFLLSFIARVLQECDTISYYDWYDWQIPITIFGHLGLWALLFVVAYTLNAMLREQLGHFTAVFKIPCLAIVGIMGAITCAWVGVASYNYWTQTKTGFRQDAEPLFDVHQQLIVAYYSLYMVSVLAAGAIALMSILSLRSRKHPAGVCQHLP